MAKVKVAGLTPEEIAVLKKQNGKIFQIDITAPDNANVTYSCVVKKPTLQTITAASAFAQTDPVKAGDILAANSILAQDPECEAIEECKIARNIEIGKLFKIADTAVKEL